MPTARIITGQQFEGSPTLQNATLAPPTGVNGPYHMGVPDWIVGINFPDPNTTKSKPWWWFVERVQPQYFQYIGGQAGGAGWQCTKNFPVIKILPIDSQPIVPTPFVGFRTIDEAVRKGSPDGTYGRFDFKDRDWWKLTGDQKKPEFSEILGIPTQTTNVKGRQPIGTVIKNRVKEWEKDWLLLADDFNAKAAGVDGLGGFGAYSSPGPYKVPTPPPNTPLPDLSKGLGDFTMYFGPIPPTEVFSTGQAFFWKQAQAFRFRVGQLDDTKWDMSVFPPTDTIPQFASAQTHDYSGFGQTNFPLFFNVV